MVTTLGDLLVDPTLLASFGVGLGLSFSLQAWNARNVGGPVNTSSGIAFLRHPVQGDKACKGCMGRRKLEV